MMSFGSETSQTALAAGRKKYRRAKGQVCAICRLCQRGAASSRHCICWLSGHHLLDHLVGECEQTGRDRKPKRTGGLEIDREGEILRLLDRHVGRLGSAQSFVHQSRKLAKAEREGLAVAP